MKIAILYIGIGSYIKYWKSFYRSSEHYFIQEAHKDYYVFTDVNSIYNKQNKRVHLVYQEDLGWPYNTLLRYKMFLKIIDELKKYDYIFFMNANLLFIKKVAKEILPIKEELVFVRRVDSNIKKRKLPYEKNKNSLAYVSDEEEGLYVRGGLNGGKSKAFIELIKTLSDNIDKDLENGIIAIWHDESHLSRYAINVMKHKKVKILPPGYLYPEEYIMPYKVYILVRKKNNDSVRYGNYNYFKWYRHNIKLAFRNILYWLLIKLKIINFIE